MTDISRKAMENLSNDHVHFIDDTPHGQFHALTCSVIRAQSDALAAAAVREAVLVELVKEHCVDSHDADCKSVRRGNGKCTCGTDDFRAALQVQP